MKVKTKKIKIESPMDILKMEVAKELGLWEKVVDQGWAGLSAMETGKVGGIMNKRIKENPQIVLDISEKIRVEKP